MEPGERPRLFLANFDFEAGLVSPSTCASRDAIRRNSELAAAWLAVARSGDVIVSGHLPDAAFGAALTALNRKGVRFARPTECFDGDLIVTPWGWERRVIAWADSCGLDEIAPPLHAVAAVNSREFSFACERDLNCGLEGQAVCCTMDAVRAAVSSFDQWLIKANFGAAGRERLSGSGPPSEAAQRWLSKRLDRDGAVFVEPKVDVIEEAGIQWEIPQDGGEPELIGVVPLLTDERGQYRGSAIPAGSAVPNDWRRAVETSHIAARRGQSLGYFGPLGIDAMRYRDSSGSIRERPVQDINARWTMGRLALGWQDLIPENRTGVLRAGPAEGGAASEGAGFHCLRISPEILDGEPPGHVFWLEIGSGDDSPSPEKS